MFGETTLQSNIVLDDLWPWIRCEGQWPKTTIYLNLVGRFRMIPYVLGESFTFSDFCETSRWHWSPNTSNLTVIQCVNGMRHCCILIIVNKLNLTYRIVVHMTLREVIKGMLKLCTKKANQDLIQFKTYVRITEHILGMFVLNLKAVLIMIPNNSNEINPFWYFWIFFVILSASSKPGWCTNRIKYKSVACFA